MRCAFTALASPSSFSTARVTVRNAAADRVATTTISPSSPIRAFAEFTGHPACDLITRPPLEHAHATMEKNRVPFGGARVSIADASSAPNVNVDRPLPSNALAHTIPGFPIPSTPARTPPSPLTARRRRRRRRRSPLDVDVVGA